MLTRRAFLGVAGGAVAASALGACAELAPDRRRLLYVVIPHPDDEFEAWSVVERSPDTYPVFVLMTHGESTMYADGRGLRTDLGEVAPSPMPFAGRGSETVRRQRVGSWHRFLDAMTGRDAAHDGEITTRTVTGGPSPAQLWVGDTSARVVYDGGDGRLSPGFVVDALHHTRELRHSELPVQQESCAVGAAYHNTSDPGSYPYPNADHGAIHEALWTTDLGLPDGQFCRTTRNDPRAAAAGRVEEVSRATYEAAMRIDPDGHRVGHLQTIYGWLGFFEPDGRMGAGDTDATTLYSRQQTFWSAFQR